MTECINFNRQESQVGPPISKSTPANHVSIFSEVTLSDRPVLLMINLVLQTAFLKTQRKPISLLLVGKAGIGKSRLLSPLAKLKTVSYVNDITPKYLIEFLENVKKGEKTFLVVPDFTNCMSHSKTTRTTLVAVLRSMTEEGVSDLSDYHLEFKSKTPIRAGLITAITRSSYQAFKENWKDIGFLSRLLPFSFKHSIATQETIMDDIDARRPDLINKISFHLEKHPKTVLAPIHLLRQLRICERMLSASTGSLPYRHQIQLNAITEALAILRGDTEIRQMDIDTISWLSNWINYDFKEV